MDSIRKSVWAKTIVIVGAFLLFSQTASAFNSVMGGTLATPLTYEVTINKIEFRNSEGTWVTFFSGSTVFDIASVNAGETVGALGAGQTLPNGTYTQMRVTIARTFGITASVSDAGGGQPARTATGNPANQTYGPVSNIGVATTDGGTATKQNIPVPSGDTIQPLSNEEFVDNQIRVTVPSSFSFTISEENATLPSLRMTFDVTDSVEFLTRGLGSAIVIPLPPQASITVG